MPPCFKVSSDTVVAAGRSRGVREVTVTRRLSHHGPEYIALTTPVCIKGNKEPNPGNTAKRSFAGRATPWKQARPTRSSTSPASARRMAPWTLPSLHVVSGFFRQKRTGQLRARGHLAAAHSRALLDYRRVADASHAATSTWYRDRQNRAAVQRKSLKADLPSDGEHRVREAKPLVSLYPHYEAYKVRFW